MRIRTHHCGMTKKATVRAAYTPGEFAAAFGRHPSWTYRLLYAQKIKAVTDMGRILIPASEVDRVLGTAKPYNPPDEAAPAERELVHA